MTNRDSVPSLPHEHTEHTEHTSQSSALTSRRRAMKRLLISVGVFVGSAIGWKAGEAIGIMTAYMLSVVGSGIGAYAGIRVAREME